MCQSLRRLACSELVWRCLVFAAGRKLRTNLRIKPPCLDVEATPAPVFSFTWIQSALTGPYPSDYSVAASMGDSDLDEAVAVPFPYITSGTISPR
jgi:hypothetical protein